MKSVSSAALKNAILQALFRRIIKNEPRFVVASYIRELIGDMGPIITNQYVEIALDSLVDERFVMRGNPAVSAHKNRFSITDKGVDFVAQGSSFSEEDGAIVNGWREPDRVQALTVSAAEEVRSYLGQCILLINQSEFSQEEQAQIVGLLKICQQIIDLPTPKLGLLRKILGWLKEIKELTPLIEFVLKLIGKF